MEYVVGVALAMGICVSATIIGFDRSRAFYPTLTIVIASYYGLFAVMGGSIPALMLESIVIAGFVLVSVLSFRVTLWLAVGALTAHGVFDLFHGYLIADPGVPLWWPGFCLTYDLVTAAYLARLLTIRRVSATSRSETDVSV
jgi:hypothetical protein